jgi:thioredoxin reductase (NADPH)
MDFGVHLPSAGFGEGRRTLLPCGPRLMASIVLFAADAAGGERCERTLWQRFGSHYDIVVCASTDEVLGTVGAGSPALVLAYAGSPDVLASLAEVGRRAPDSRRLLLFDWDQVVRVDEEFQRRLGRSMALGEVHEAVLGPHVEPDEEFCRTVSEQLARWAEEHGPQFEAIRIVDERFSPRSHELRDLAHRNGIPFGFYPAAGDDGRQLLAEAGLDGARLPVVLVTGGPALVAPDNATIAAALGGPATVGDGTFDVAIVGGGPAGLAAAVYASSEGLRTLIIEREAPGGQAGTSSLIRNYPGFPSGVSGRELAQRATRQASSLGTEFLILGDAVALQPGPPHRLTLADGTDVEAGVVVIATGVSYRRLDIPSVESLVGAGVYYGSAASEASGLVGQPVYVVGGGNSAGQAALHLARFAAHVTLLVRSGSLASSMSDYLIRQLDAIPNLTIRYRSEVVDAHGEGRCEALDLRERGGRVERVEAAALYVLIGGVPRTDWLPTRVARDSSGYVLTGTDLPAGTGPVRSSFHTTCPGVFAVGDVRHGSMKRVASAVGEGAVCVAEIHRYLAERPAQHAGATLGTG